MSDADAIQRQLSFREVSDNLLMVPYPYPEGAATEFVQRCITGESEGAYRWVAIRLDQEVVIGGLGLDVVERHRRAEVGYWFGMEHWGQGFATEAVRHIIEFGFAELKLERIQAGVFANNDASARVLEKSGMTFEGLQRKVYRKGDRQIDSRMFSIVRAEWTGP